MARQRTQTINALRGHLAEFGVVAPQGLVPTRTSTGIPGTSASVRPAKGVACPSALLAVLPASAPVPI